MALYRIIIILKVFGMVLCIWAGGREVEAALAENLPLQVKCRTRTGTRQLESFPLERHSDWALFTCSSSEVDECACLCARLCQPPLLLSKGVDVVVRVCGGAVPARLGVRE